VVREEMIKNVSACTLLMKKVMENVLEIIWMRERKKMLQ
jgi:hypothetical protein